MIARIGDGDCAENRIARITRIEGLVARICDILSGPVWQELLTRGAVDAGMLVNSGGSVGAPLPFMEKLTRPALDDRATFDIIGAAMAVHGELGCGFVESVYCAAFAFELQDRGISFRREVRLPIEYRGRVLPVSFRVDFICHDDVLVEVKALHALGPIEHAQAINYLKAAKCRRGLVLNFGSTSLQFKRVVNSAA